MALDFAALMQEMREAEGAEISPSTPCTTLAPETSSTAHSGNTSSTTTPNLSSKEHPQRAHEEQPRSAPRPGDPRTPVQEAETGKYAARPFAFSGPVQLVGGHDVSVEEAGDGVVDLSEFVVGGGGDAGVRLDRVMLVPEFVSEEDEQAMLVETREAPECKWVRLRRRRLQNWGGWPEAQGLVGDKTMPVWLQASIDRLVRSGVWAAVCDGDVPEPNHVLLNEYHPSEGISAHKDGPLYHPVVCIYCLGGSSMMNFYPSLSRARDKEPLASVFLPRRALLVFSQAAYQDMWHAIEEVGSDVITERVLNAEQMGFKVGDVVPRETTRVSLTVRHVPSRKKGDEQEEG